MATSRRAARLTRIAIVLICALVGVGLRGVVATADWRVERPSGDELRVIAAGAHLLAHGDTDVTAFHDDAPLAAHAASLPWLGLSEGLLPRDPAGPPEQVGWSALYGTPHPAGDVEAAPREMLPTAGMLLGARAPGLLAFLLALFATVLVAESLFGRWAGLAAGLVLALDPVTAVRGGFAVAEPWAQAGTACLLLAAAAHWETLVGGTDRRPGRERRSALALGAACGFALLSSVTVWPVAGATLLWLHTRAAAATARGDPFRRGRTGRCVKAAMACAAVLAIGCLGVHWRVLVQPAVNAVTAFDGLAGETFRSAALPIALPAALALIAAPWLFRDRADLPALLLAVAVTAVATAIVAPGRLALPALAAATPAIAIMAGCLIGRIANRSQPIAAALALLVLPPLLFVGFGVQLLRTFPTHGEREGEPAQPTDRDYERWFVNRYIDQRRPRVLHLVTTDSRATVEIRERTRVVHHAEITWRSAQELLKEDGAVVVVPYPAPSPLFNHIVARARGTELLE